MRIFEFLYEILIYSWDIFEGSRDSKDSKTKIDIHSNRSLR